MKLRHLVNEPLELKGKVIARFGQAALVRQCNGSYQLAGGNCSDHAEAKEWISLFLHEAVVSQAVDHRG